MHFHLSVINELKLFNSLFKLLVTFIDLNFRLIMDNNWSFIILINKLLLFELLFSVIMVWVQNCL